MRVDDRDLHPLHRLVVLGAAADEDAAVGEDRALRGREQAPGEDRGRVLRIDAVSRGRPGGGCVLLPGGVVCERGHVPVPLGGEVYRQLPRRTRRADVRQGGPRGGVRGGEAAVGLEVPAGVRLEQRHLDLRDADVVCGGAGQVEVQGLPAEHGAGDVEKAVRRCVPRTWAFTVSVPRSTVDVLSPRSSVARTVNRYVPAFRSNGVVYAQL